MDAEDFKTCLISIGYNLVKPITSMNICLCVINGTNWKW